jgi:glycosyltransferase involved in cell wall biosynthesis
VWGAHRFSSLSVMVRVRKVANRGGMYVRLGWPAAADGPRTRWHVDRLGVELENKSKRWLRRRGLVIVDDVFPHLLSGFRIAEFNAYLEHWPLAEVHTFVGSTPLLGEHLAFPQVVRHYRAHYPALGRRVRRLQPNRVLGGPLVYCVFLNNASRYLDLGEAARSPFVFTLYPGGGFALDEAASSEALRRVMDSPLLRRVVVTQRVTRDYLLGAQLCDPSLIEFIYGVVVPLGELAGSPLSSKKYLVDKKSFDVCFVAAQYMPGGANKGFDVFAKVARRLAREYEDMVFHVVGNFYHYDYDLLPHEERVAIRFHGPLSTPALADLFQSMDVILSPNAPFLLSPGNFDGFPTGACVEAGLCGVAVFCTDELLENSEFKDGEDLVIISREPDEICHDLVGYYQDPEKLYLLADRGQRAFAEVFSHRRQIAPRLRLLEREIGATRSR